MSGFPKAPPAVVSLSASTTLAGAGTFLCDAAGGAFTVTLPSPTALNGYSILLRKTDSTTNVVTIAGSLDGAITPGLLSVPGDALDLVSDGTTWRVVSAVQGPLVFDTTQSWTVPAGWHFIRAMCIFGGGGGGGGASIDSTTSSTYGGGGGSAGPVIMLDAWPVAAGDTLGVTVGAGGAGGTGAAVSSSGIVNGGDAGSGGASYLSLNGTQLTSSSHFASGGGGGNTASNTWGYTSYFDTNSGPQNNTESMSNSTTAPGAGGSNPFNPTAPNPLAEGPVGGAMGGQTSSTGLGGGAAPGNTVTTWATVPPTTTSSYAATADGEAGGSSTTPGCGGSGGGSGSVGGTGGNGGAGGPGQVTVWRLS